MSVAIVLLDEVDRAAASLLRSAFGEDVTPLDHEEGDDKVPTRVSIVEKVKAFEAVTKYLELRHELVPPPPPDQSSPPIDALRSKFHGANRPKAARGGNRARATNGSAVDDGGSVAGET